MSSNCFAQLLYPYLRLILYEMCSQTVVAGCSLQESLRSLTKGAQQLIHQDLAWEPLEVAPSVALEVFSHSR